MLLIPLEAEEEEAALLGLPVGSSHRRCVRYHRAIEGQDEVSAPKSRPSSRAPWFDCKDLHADAGHISRGQSECVDGDSCPRIADSICDPVFAAAPDEAHGCRFARPAAAFDLPESLAGQGLDVVHGTNHITGPNHPGGGTIRADVSDDDATIGCRGAKQNSVCFLHLDPEITDGA